MTGHITLEPGEESLQGGAVNRDAIRRRSSLKSRFIHHPLLFLASRY
jgi:hypothetical protein